MSNLEIDKIYLGDCIEGMKGIESGSVDMVLDCCMGSGTTAVACIGTDRHFIGFEKNETYFERACKRIEKRYAEGVQMEL